MQWNTEIEEALRADPYDEAQWSVLEDWTLAQGDDRARVIELDKAGDSEAASTAQRQLLPQLFGTKYRELQRVVFGTWRAGYLVRAQYQAPAARRYDVLAQILATRCTRLLRAFTIDIDQPGELAEVPRALAGTAVRELMINAFWKPPNQPATLDPALLAPLPLEVLRMHGRAIALPYGESFVWLRELWLTPGSPAELRELFRAAWPRLAHVAILVGTLVHRHGVDTAPFDTLLAAETAPALRRLHIRDAPPALQRALIERLADSALLPQLEQFSFGYDRLDLSRVPTEYRETFERFA